MSVASIAAGIEREAMKTPRREYRRCIYCGLIVGEDIRLKDGRLEREAFSETSEGPVCSRCLADPCAKSRAGQWELRGRRRAIIRRQDGYHCMSREERDVMIIQMHDDGMTYTEIGPLVGLTKQGAATAAARMRERLARDA